MKSPICERCQYCIKHNAIVTLCTFFQKDVSNHTITQCSHFKKVGE